MTGEREDLAGNVPGEPMSVEARASDESPNRIVIDINVNHHIFPGGPEMTTATPDPMAAPAATASRSVVLSRILAVLTAMVLALIAGIFAGRFWFGPSETASKVVEKAPSETVQVKKSAKRLPAPAPVDDEEEVADDAPAPATVPARRGGYAPNPETQERPAVRGVPVHVAKRCGEIGVKPEWNGISWVCEKSSKVTLRGDGPRVPALEKTKTWDEFVAACNSTPGWKIQWSEKLQRSWCAPLPQGGR